MGERIKNVVDKVSSSKLWNEGLIGGIPGIIMDTDKNIFQKSVDLAWRGAAVGGLLYASWGCGTAIENAVNNNTCDPNKKSPAAETVPMESNFEASKSSPLINEIGSIKGTWTQDQLKSEFSDRVMPAIACSPYSKDIQAAGAGVTLVEQTLTDTQGHTQASLFLLNLANDGTTVPITIHTETGKPYEVLGFFVTDSKGAFFAPVGNGNPEETAALLPIGTWPDHVDPNVSYFGFGHEVKIGGEAIIQSPQDGEYLIKVDSNTGETTYIDPYSGLKTTWKSVDEAPAEIRSVVSAQKSATILPSPTPGTITIPGVGTIAPTPSFGSPTPESTATAEYQYKICSPENFAECQIPVEDLFNGKYRAWLYTLSKPFDPAKVKNVPLGLYGNGTQIFYDLRTFPHFKDPSTEPFRRDVTAGYVVYKGVTSIVMPLELYDMNHPDQNQWVIVTYPLKQNGYENSFAEALKYVIKTWREDMAITVIRADDKTSMYDSSTNDLVARTFATIPDMADRIARFTNHNQLDASGQDMAALSAPGIVLGSDVINADKPIFK